MLGELSDANFRLSEMAEVGDVSFGISKLGDARASFRKPKINWVS